MSDQEPPPDAERVRLSLGTSALLGVAVAVFITVTGYVSAIPGVHHSWALAAVEGIVIGLVVAVVASGKGLILRERKPPPPRRNRQRR